MLRFPLVVVAILVFTVARAAEAPPRTPNPVIASAQQRIAAFHAGEKPSGSVVRLVYFHPADRDPLPDYAARLDRIMTDISGFFRDGLEQRFAVKSGGLPLERKAGKLVIHMVRGQHPAAHYEHTSGDETWAEVRKALAGTIDPEREHVLILYGLCRREPDGRFVFDAPYYGATWSDQRHGLCHAADCDVLDPLLLTANDKPMVFTEHYYPRIEMTLAKFNSWYLGGIAHELGHGLGLPHDNGGPGEAPGISLMGGGNLHYREQLWGGREPAYLSLATALRLAAHPLFTQSDKARWQTADATFENLTASAEKGTLRISGRVRAPVPPCAIIAAAFPVTARTDHGAMTFCAAVGEDGKFSVEMTNLKAPKWQINLGCLLANGAETRMQFTLRCDERGEPAADELASSFVTDGAEQAFMRNPAQAAKLLTDEAIAAAPNDEARRRLRLLRDMKNPEPEPVDLATAKAARVFLSDARWTKAEVGWGKVARNRYWFHPGQWEGALLKLGGEVFAKGLYAHSKSEFVFPLGGNWKTFSATVGLRDGAASQGSAVFTVIGDGREIFRSKLLRTGEKETVRIDIAGVKELALQASGGEGSNNNSWAIWAEPVIGK